MSFKLSPEALALFDRPAKGEQLDAEAAHIAAEARRRQGVQLAHPGHARRREKLFGQGRPRALDRNAKARIAHLARCLMRRTEKGRAYGQITAKAFAVLQALLWGFHNAKSGLCFPSYERIAESAGCARSTVAEALRALEDAGLLTWVNRLKRVRELADGLPGIGATRSRVLRTSNGYRFNDPGSSSKSEIPTGTANQGFFSPKKGPANQLDPDSVPIWRRATRFSLVCGPSTRAY